MNVITTKSGKTFWLVCGDDPLTYRLASELITQYGRQVTVILPSRRRNHGPQISGLRVRVVESERLDADAFRRPRVATADATPAAPRWPGNWACR